MRYTRIALAFLLTACFLVAAVVAGQQADGTPEPGQSGQPVANPIAGGEPKRNALSEREASLAARTRQLVNDYAKAVGEDARAKIKDDLASVVKEHFQLRQALREQELAELEEQVKRLRGLLDKRQEARESIIGTRLNQLLHPSEGLGWDEGQAERSDGAVRADEQAISEMDFDIEGVVLDVWENRLIEISLGIEDGVRPGHRLIVHRDGKALDTVRVRTLYATRAIARLSSNLGPGFIRKGDRVARIPSQRVQEMLQGNWQVLSTESQGHQLPEKQRKTRRFAFHLSGTFHILDGRGKSKVGPYVLDEQKQRILFEPGGEEVFFGRYKFEGDRLLLAISNETTPAEMASKPGSDIQVYTLERIPEGTRKADPTPAGKADASAGSATRAVPPDFQAGPGWSPGKVPAIVGVWRVGSVQKAGSQVPRNEIHRNRRVIFLDHRFFILDKGQVKSAGTYASDPAERMFQLVSDKAMFYAWLEHQAYRIQLSLIDEPLPLDSAAQPDTDAEIHILERVVSPTAEYKGGHVYLIVKGGGRGDGVTRISFTGNETVLDALAQIEGLSDLSGKDIWISRPVEGRPDQTLPVSWKDIMTARSMATNYGLLPGDRVFVGPVDDHSEQSGPNPAKE